MPLPTPFAAPPIPHIDLLSFLLDKPAIGYPEDRVIFQDDNSDDALSFAEVRSRVRTFGNALLTRCQLQRGDRVLILALHGLHYPVALFGVICAGCEAVPANPALLIDDIEKYITVTGAKAIIVHQPFIKMAEALKTKFPNLKLIEICSTSDLTSDQNWSFQRLLEGEEMDWSRNQEEARRTAYICFSSGTSGLPKACPLTQSSIVANTFTYYHSARGRRAREKSVVGDKVLAAFPPFHAAGIWGSMIFPLQAGNLQILMSRFLLSKFLDLVKKHRPYQLALAPPIVLALATAPIVSQYDFTSVKLISVGAAPLTKELSDRCVKRLEGLGGSKIKFLQVWGMTEGVCTLTTYDEEDEEATQHGGVGYPLSHLSIKLVSIPTAAGSEDVEVKPGEPGEILVKGSCIFEGYLGHTDADRAEYFTSDGYYRTGDVGIADSLGRLHIVDRIKELIKISGFQVAPAELEGLLLTHPDVDDVAVIGITSSTTDGQVIERPRAYIVLKPSAALAARHPELIRKSIHEWFNQRVVGYKRLTGGIKILRSDKGEAVPRSPAGKILRRLLRDQVALEQNSVAKI